MLDVPCGALQAALNGDPEFQLAARYWDASLRLGIGGAPLRVRIEQGRVAEIGPADPEEAVDLAIDGPEAAWEKLLAAVPRPFYQSVYAAAVHHELSLSGDPLSLYAYLAALTRLIDVLRAEVSGLASGAR